MSAVALTLAVAWPVLERSGREPRPETCLARRALGRDGGTALGLTLAMVMGLERGTGKVKDH